MQTLQKFTSNPDSGWALLYFGVFLAASAFTIWSVIRRKSTSIPGTLLGVILNGLGVWGLPTISLIIGAGAAAKGIPIISAILGSQPPPPYVPLNLNSADSGVRLEVSSLVQYDGTNITIPLRLTSSRPLKIFTIGTQGFSISTQAGNACHVRSISGVHDFDRSSFADNTDQMQLIGPSAPIGGNLTAYCDRQIAANDFFILSFEFFFLPPGVVQSSPEAKHYGVLNFSGDRIGSEPDRTSTASPLPISHAAAIGDASAAYVPLNQTSPNKNLSISISKYVETYDNLHVNVPLRVIAETPIKVFMILNDQNFSLTTNTGNRCHIGTLYGLYTFDQSFPDNTDAMQVVGPNSFQPSNPMAYCDRQLASNDKFVLSIQLSTLPADVVQSTPAAKQFVPASFTLDNIGLAP